MYFRIVIRKEIQDESEAEVPMEKAMIVQGNWQRFLTLSGERLLLVNRKHVFVLLSPMLVTIFLLSLMIAIAYMLFIHFFFSLSFFFVTVLLLVSLGISAITKIIVDWYFHLYIITSRKILEVWYTPLSSLVVSDILLDRVNCTEIDVQTHGIVGEMIDIGDIVITFDRPTHREEFILKDILGCHRIGTFLTKRLLDQTPTSTVQTIWWRQPRQAAAY
jgi:hypothetical protein